MRRDIAEMLHGPIQTRLLSTEHRIRQAEGILVTEPAEALSLLARFEDRFSTCLEGDPRVLDLDDSLENRISEPVRLSVIPGDRWLLVLQDDGQGGFDPGSSLAWG